MTIEKSITHLVNFERNETLCGKKMTDLIKDEPNGYTAAGYIQCSTYIPEIKIIDLAIRQASLADCSECKKAMLRNYV